MKKRLPAIVSAVWIMGSGGSFAQQTPAPPALDAPGAPGALGAPPKGPRPPDLVARSPPIDASIKMALAIVSACRSSRVGISVVDAAGLSKLTYIPDGVAGSHAQTAFRKANAALTFKARSGEIADLAKTDPIIAGKLAANPNAYLLWAGGVPILAGNEVIGAVGVSGAEPSAEDERCAIEGIKKLQKQLK